MSIIYDVFSTCDVYWLSRFSADVSLVSEIASDVVAGRSITSNKDQKGGWLASDGHSDVFACNFSKDTQSAVGVFSFSMRSERRYLDLIQPGDLFFIFMSNELQDKKKEPTLVTVGILDRISENKAVMQGATTSVLSLVGKDFGKILLETETIFDPAFAQEEQQFFTEEFFNRINDQAPGQSPLEMVYSIIDLYFSVKATKNKITEIQWRYPGIPDKSLVSLINFKDFVQAPLYGYTDQIDLQITQASSVWDLCESFCNRSLNEFFIDVRDYIPQEKTFLEHQEEIVGSFLTAEDIQKQQTKRDFLHGSLFGPFRPDTESKSTVALVFRQTPYDVGAFYKLPVFYVDETEVEGSTNFGKSSQNIFNFIRLKIPSLPVEAQEFTYGIRVNPSSVTSFGLKRLEAETIYGFSDSQMGEGVVAGSTIQDQFIGVYDYYTGILSVWNAFNEYLINGSMTVRFRPEIRVGCRLCFTYTKGETLEQIDFYIQAINHSFVYQQGESKTNITLVRGIKKTDEAEFTDRSIEMVQNMRWGKSGVEIPKEFNPWVRLTTAGSFVVSGETVESINRGL